MSEYEQGRFIEAAINACRGYSTEDLEGLAEHGGFRLFLEASETYHAAVKERTTACVKACAGVPTDVLEKDPIQEMRTVISLLLAFIPADQAADRKRAEIVLAQTEKTP